MRILYRSSLYDTISRTVAVILAILLMSCGQGKSSFGGLARNVKSPRNDGNVAALGPIKPYAFSLQIGEGKTAVLADASTAIPGIKDEDTGEIVSGEALGEWRVAVYKRGGTPGEFGAVEESPLDLSSENGMVGFQADFKNEKTGRSGTAYASVFVDGSAPTVNLVRLANSSDGQATEIFWSQSDNFGINPESTTLIACKQKISDLAIKTTEDLNKLPPDCTIVRRGAQFGGEPSNLTLGPVTIGGAVIPPSQLEFGLFAQDLLGLSAFAWISDPPRTKAQLLLATRPSSLSYVSRTTNNVELQLTSILGNASTRIDSDANLWADYVTAIRQVSPAPSEQTSAFSKMASVTLGGADGLYRFEFTVTPKDSEDAIPSNKEQVSFVLDRTPPVITGIGIDVPGAILTSTTVVKVAWTVVEQNGLQNQEIFIKRTGETSFTRLAILSGNQASYQFSWGSHTQKGFEIQIVAKDLAGNSGTGVSRKWTPQVFNAALMTQSVRCLFCHLKVQGDLGGIDFPGDTGTHGETGTDFSLSGALYATNGIPTKLLGKALGGDYPNYNNQSLVIFPKGNKFPTLTKEIMKDRVNGSLTLDTFKIQRVHEGNLLLDGSKPNKPIKLKGEVFVDGNLIIKGKYEGVGTIYAQNIYIVDDLVAQNSPFPFSDTLSVALDEARAAIQSGKDGLYLGALHEVVVGPYTEAMSTSCLPAGSTEKCVTAAPYGMDYSLKGTIDESTFYTLGTKAEPLKDTSGNVVTVTGTRYNPFPDANGVWEKRALLEVNRVDAFIYAQRTFQWYSFSNSLLNGGFMAPYSAVVNQVSRRIYLRSKPQANGKPGILAGINWASNPRNGLLPLQNVIRYDYRLRAGGAGFETLKSFFDQP